MPNKVNNTQEFLHDLKEKLNDLLRHLGHEMQVIFVHTAEGAAHDLEHRAHAAISDAATVITDDIRAWGLEQWRDHCEDWENTPPTDDWCLEMWNNRPAK